MFLRPVTKIHLIMIRQKNMATIDNSYFWLAEMFEIIYWKITSQNF